MKFHTITLTERLDKYATLRPNDFGFTSERGWSIEAAEGGYLLRHDKAERPLYLHGSRVAYAEVLEESAAKKKAG